MSNIGRVYIRRAKLDQHGYTEHGQYYGATGVPLYMCTIGDFNERGIRGHSLAEVKAIITDKYPLVWFPRDERANPLREVIRRVDALPTGSERWNLAEGTYCNRGRPMFSHYRQEELLRDSEHYKHILTDGNYVFGYLWDEWQYPTQFVWGLKPGPEYYQIRYRGEEVFRTLYKTRLLKAWKEKAWLTQCT